MAEATHSDGDKLSIMTTVALKGVLGELEPDFRREHGCDFSMTFGPGGVTAERVRAGHVDDVVISAPPTLGALTADGYLIAGSQRPIARSIIGVAVRAGAARPKIATVDEFKRALLEAKSIAYSNPATGAASGVHFTALLAKLGIADEINAKAKLGQGGPVAEYVARGEAELAIQQICEHMLVRGVDVVGPLPAELQSVTTLAVALHRKAARPDAAVALAALLVSPHAEGIMHKHGLEAVV